MHNSDKFQLENTCAAIGKAIANAKPLPTVNDLLGSDPTFTGDLDSVEYLKTQRAEVTE